MPGMAFKLWIYCLLEAAPYPDHKRNLAIGELWLSYQNVRENLGEGDKKVSMSTVSAALKYLEQHGYITLQSEKFKGIKAKIVNWGDYQAFYTDSETPATPRVVVAESPTTLTVADDYSQSSRPTTPTVVARTAQPYNGKASIADKNYIENSIKNNTVVVTVADAFTQEFGRPLSPNEIKQLAHWQETFSQDLIKEALVRASLQDKRTIAYVGGILKNWSRAGITSVAETQQEQTKPSTKGGKRNAKSKPGYCPNEVDWINEPDTL